jgi:hypothetical protein
LISLLPIQGTPHFSAPASAFRFGNNPCIQIPLQKAVDLEGYSHGRWGTDTQMKLDVLSAVHFIAEAERLITSTTIKNSFVKYGFSNDHVSAVKLSEGDEYVWYSLQHLGVQCKACTTCDSALEVCGILNVAHLTMPEEE